MFKFQPNVSNKCHEFINNVYLLISDIAILNIKSADYSCIISGISKDEAINLMKKCQFDQKKQNITKQKNLLLDIKIGKEILTFNEIEIEKKIYCHKSPFLKKDIGIEKVLVSNKVSFDQKIFIE